MWQNVLEKKIVKKKTIWSVHSEKKIFPQKKAIRATSLIDEQLGTALAKYWMAPDNQSAEIRPQLITSISGNAHQNFEVVCAWQQCNAMMITHYRVFKKILKHWWHVSLEIPLQYLLLFAGITARCLESLLSSLKVCEMSKMSLNANTCSVYKEAV